MSTIRFKFTRGEELRFISHLDQQRLFQRAFRRAGLNIAHSNGFNPHPKLSFALAMSVGLMSDSEYGDVVLTSDIDLMAFTKRLNAALPKGLKVVEARKIPQGKASLSASLTDSSYRIEVMLAAGINAASLDELLKTYLSLDEVILEKRNKKGKLVPKNIRPFIKDIKVLSIEEETAVLELKLKYIEQQSVKPELVLQTVNQSVKPCFIIDPTVVMTRKELNLNS
ncbi:TIGR03936 family radical SAM-associated protein [Eubacterium sp. 1001713B170207_170306_E7]|uniref:TIGR03936 family radical SAM-associated protein n=1 Tax=Eubacterium sp. 1001713B170207_170306_E7 TaxID=2787097 RepID=UPI00189850C0|nr:TIGR03936 family radical SAM-associated protein [Eubacterium sp. 1001713B170207_170306_E7]